MHPQQYHHLKNQSLRSQDGEDQYLVEREAAALLRLSPRTLQRWRLEGSGPPYLLLGRHIVYTRQDLDAWANAQQRHSTSERTNAVGR